VARGSTHLRDFRAHSCEIAQRRCHHGGGDRPKLAMDMMKKGESMMIMSDGSMMTMNVERGRRDEMSAMMKPMKKCAVS